MRKRSKTEVEIRNILSEIFLHSLSCSTNVDKLKVINKYCGKASDRAINRIYLKDLVENKTSLDRAQIYWRQLSNDVLVKRLFVSGPRNSIKLKSRYAKYQTFICRKTSRYLKLTSRLKTRGEGIQHKLAGKVEVGVMLFNNGFFFESHEYLEEIWLKEKGREKTFLKGLIHACVAFYHFEYENIKGTVNYLKRSSSTLKEFQPNFLGVDVSSFLSDVDKALKVLTESNSKSSIDAVPRIKPVDEPYF